MAVVAWHLSVSLGSGRRAASLACPVAQRGSPRHAGLVGLRPPVSFPVAVVPSRAGRFRPRIYWAAARGTLRPAENQTHGACRWLVPRQERWARSASYPFGARDGVVRGGSLRRPSSAAVVWPAWTRSFTRPVSRTVRLSTLASAGAPRLFHVNAEVSPSGSGDARLPVCVCSLFVAGSGMPASRARFGATHLSWGCFLCLLCFPGALQAGAALFLFVCLILFVLRFFFFRRRYSSLLRCILPWARVFAPPPPPPLLLPPFFSWFIPLLPPCVSYPLCLSRRSHFMHLLLAPPPPLSFVVFCFFLFFFRLLLSFAPALWFLLGGSGAAAPRLSCAWSACGGVCHALSFGGSCSFVVVRLVVVVVLPPPPPPPPGCRLGGLWCFSSRPSHFVFPCSCFLSCRACTSGVVPLVVCMLPCCAVLLCLYRAVWCGGSLCGLRFCRPALLLAALLFFVFCCSVWSLCAVLFGAVLRFVAVRCVLCHAVPGRSCVPLSGALLGCVLSCCGVSCVVLHCSGFFLRHGGFLPKTSSQTAHNARFLEGQPREWNPYKKIMPL